MYPSTGLKTALNAMREMSVSQNSIYHQYVPVVTDTTTIGEFGAPILDSQNLNVLNDFVGLLKKVVYTAVYNKTFNNPLAELEGERMPLGQFIEDVYVNPAKARGFNVNDFAGLLQKYEAEVATQYFTVNSDLQYQVTITREKIRNAFTSWDNLESLVSGMINSLFNGAYITRYNQSKGLVLSAFSNNSINYEVVTAPTDSASAKTLVQKMRADFRKFQVPSTKYNAWCHVKGENAFALKTWSDPQDIVILISADIEALIDVEVLAAAFNMNKADFIGRVIVVDDFSQYNEDGTLAVDGSNILAMIADRSWFKIKTQDFAMDEFYNANNRTWQYYLNDVRMCNYSLFANAKVYATSAPQIAITNLSFGVDSIDLDAGDSEGLELTVTPTTGNYPTITYEITSGDTYAEIVSSDPFNNIVVIKGLAAGTATLKATSGSVSATVTINVSAAA